MTDSNIGILQQFNDLNTNRAIIHVLLKAAGPLPLRYATPVSIALVKLAGQDNATIHAVHNFMREKKLRAQWDQYKWLVVLLLTALICWLMVAVAG